MAHFDLLFKAGVEAVTNSTRDKPYDHYINVDGTECAGKHIIFDIYDAENLTDVGYIKKTLQECIVKTNATLLHIQLHHFGVGKGVAGVAVLAESHISIHTWPEKKFAAIDVFMGGNTKPEICIDIFKERFKTHNIKTNILFRGIVNEYTRDTRTS